MDITQIENLISEAAEAIGYNSIIASETQLEGAIECLPAAWITLPKVLWVEGREQGTIGHSITLSLIDDYKGYSFEDQRSRVNKMEEDALEIMTQISTQDGVVEVESLTITPRLIPTTRHDNIGCICAATIVSYF